MSAEQALRETGQPIFRTFRVDNKAVGAAGRSRTPSGPVVRAVRAD